MPHLHFLTPNGVTEQWPPVKLGEIKSKKQLRRVRIEIEGPRVHGASPQRPDAGRICGP